MGGELVMVVDGEHPGGDDPEGVLVLIWSGVRQMTDGRGDFTVFTTIISSFDRVTEEDIDGILCKLTLGWPMTAAVTDILVTRRLARMDVVVTILSTVALMLAFDKN